MELVECFRRLFLTAALILIDFDVTWQIMAPLGVSIFTSRFFCHWKPYRTRFDNILGEGGGVLVRQTHSLQSRAGPLLNREV